MTYAALLAYVGADTLPEPRLKLAAKLADKFNATLIGLSALVARPAMIADGIAVEGETEAEVKEKLADKEAWFRQIVDAEHRTTEWRSKLEFPTDALVRESRCADLIVIGKGLGFGNISSVLDTGFAILRAGRPFLVVPDEIDSLKAEHVVIGWSDRREARRAVQDALPFLKKASRVSVVKICKLGEEQESLEATGDVVGYLKRHRVEVGPEVVLHKDDTGAAQIIGFAQEEDADLIVTGAYGHSRVGEWIFGGVTHDLLRSSPLCCLMSH